MVMVRRWRSWYPWTTLAMVAHAFLVVAAVTNRARACATWADRVTYNELQHLFAALVIHSAADPDHRLRWSVWRRRHQHRARTYHYRRQATHPAHHKPQMAGVASRAAGRG
jgi:hypothetical protein